MGNLLIDSCRSIVGIVDNLGQVVFKTLSDQFAVRDGTKLYLVSLVDADKTSNTGKKGEKKDKEKEDKSTAARMCTALLKCAGIFLEYGKQAGLELQPDYESQIKSQNGNNPSGTGAEFLFAYN